MCKFLTMKCNNSPSLSYNKKKIMATLRETKKFKLFEGEGAGKGCYAVMNKETFSLTDWDTGVEGAEWADNMLSLPTEEFIKECEKLSYS